MMSLINKLETNNKYDCSCEALGGLGPVRTGIAGEAFDRCQDTPDADPLLNAKGCRLSVQRFEAFFAGEDTEDGTAVLDSWDQSDPRHSYNIVGRNPSSTSLLHASIDEQLNDWKAFWTRIPSVDPFRRDWTPKPFEYA